MLNQVVIVGKILSMSTPDENEWGEYIIWLDAMEDVIPILFNGTMAESVFEHANNGTVLGIKARAKMFQEISVTLVAEKATFINAKEEEQQEV